MYLLLRLAFLLLSASAAVQISYSNRLKTLEDVYNYRAEVKINVILNETEPEPTPTSSSSSSSTIPPHVQFHNSHLNTEEDPDFTYNSSDCPEEEWNNVRTDSIPMAERHKLWTERNIGNMSYLYHETFSLLAAFVYKDQIIVTMTSENQFNKTVYCRYYDCRRKEISDQFEALVYPESTVFCARRPGAKYISISETLEEKPEYSVPIVPRIEKPPHYFTVCMATLYGDEPKFLQIVDFIEYYKLQGATFFHIYLRNVTDYDRVLLDDYVRTGDIEIVKMHDHHWRDDFMWHHVQINDCHHRNKYFSKWTALIDVDERIEMKSESYKTVTSFLDTIHDPNIVNLHFKIQWVIKDFDTPARYENDGQLIDEMIFHKYQNTSRIGSFWTQPKCIIRPEKIGMMTIHAPLAIYSGIRRSLVDDKIGVVRHYRNVEQRVFKGAYAKMMAHAPFNITPIDTWLDRKLTDSILNRVKWVYDVPDVTCDQKQAIYRHHGRINASCWVEEQERLAMLNNTLLLDPDLGSTSDSLFTEEELASIKPQPTSETNNDNQK
ncbi:hypothetical protein B9Z55_018421 [Caenorhabditis nigoni]|uniref:Glycosyltransferase family 92 protein n=1 Tax=Caenorhabditis nigoni TaxID=1611254 RepID=A0A2G5TE63_9PELO|nr:hypothetical protein B9Z55_018421 [Caenorhabditis nigoni]